MKYIHTFENKINKQDDKEREYFLKYMIDYYGPDGIFKIFTKQQIEKYIDIFMKKRKELDQWGDADSFDREVFRDYLFFKYDMANFNDLEYYHQLRNYFTEEEINANKYNL